MNQHKTKQHWTYEAVRMEAEWFDTLEEAFDAEKNAIRLEKPLHNILRYKPTLPKKERTEKTKSVRLEFVLPGWLKAKLLERSEEMGISMAEYIKDTLKCSVISDSSTSRENKP